jgi:hypothetical protein
MNLKDYCNHGDALPQLQNKQCIRKYMKTSDGSTYFILMQPVPDDFDLVKGDLNIFHVPTKTQELIDEAKRQNESLVQIAQNTYRVDFFESTEVFIIYNVFSHLRQRLPNRIVFKLVKYELDRISYVVWIYFYFLYS